MRALFVTDIDGTLLDERGELPPRNLEAMRRAAELGVTLALATGRRRSSYRPERARLAGIPHRVSLSNGAVLLAEDNETIASMHVMPWDGLIEMAHRSPHPTVIHGLAVTVPPAAPLHEEETDGWVLARDGRFLTAKYFTDRSTHHPVSGAPPLARDLVHASVEIATRAEADALVPRMREAFGDGVDLHVCNLPRIGTALLEAVVLGGKGRGLRDLASLLAIPLDATGAIGDDMNDATLLDAATHRYAVGGSVLASRRHDAVATVSSREAAVADALNRFLSELR